MNSSPIPAANEPQAANPVRELPSPVPAPDPVPESAAAPPSLAELFIAFAKISLSGFGGVLAWSRRMMVEERKWMTAEQFNEIYALCSFLPGGNIINFSVIFGRTLARTARQRGGARRTARTADDPDHHHRRASTLTTAICRGCAAC